MDLKEAIKVVEDWRPSFHDDARLAVLEAARGYHDNGWHDKQAERARTIEELRADNQSLVAAADSEIRHLRTEMDALKLEHDRALRQLAEVRDEADKLAIDKIHLLQKVHFAKEHPGEDFETLRRQMAIAYAERDSPIAQDRDTELDAIAFILRWEPKT